MCIITGPTNEPWRRGRDWNDNSSGQPSCPSLVPLSRRRSRKGINQRPNKTRYSLRMRRVGKRRKEDTERREKERSSSRSTKTRQNTNYLTANTSRTRVDIPDVERGGTAVLSWAKGQGARESERRKFRAELARVRQKRSLWRLWKWNCNRKRVYGT